MDQASAGVPGDQAGENAGPAAEGAAGVPGQSSGDAAGAPDRSFRDAERVPGGVSGPAPVLVLSHAAKSFGAVHA